MGKENVFRRGANRNIGFVVKARGDRPNRYMVCHSVLPEYGKWFSLEKR